VTNLLRAVGRVPPGFRFQGDSPKQLRFSCIITKHFLSNHRDLLFIFLEAKKQKRLKLQATTTIACEDASESQHKRHRASWLYALQHHFVSKPKRSPQPKRSSPYCRPLISRTNIYSTCRITSSNIRREAKASASNYPSYALWRHRWQQECKHYLQARHMCSVAQDFEFPSAFIIGEIPADAKYTPVRLESLI